MSSRTYIPMQQDNCGLQAINRRAISALQKLHKTNAGTTTLEFALTIPFLMFITMLLIETTLFTSTFLMVRYAAFTATRSAIVTIPAFFSDEEPLNEIYYPNPEDNSNSFYGKYKYIREAAVYAIAPIANLDTQTAGSGTQYPSSSPSWVINSQRLQRKLQYAANNTIVHIYTTTLDYGNSPPTPLDTELSGYSIVGPKDAVTVKVTHRYKLSMPIVKSLIGDDDKTIDISAHFTLNNEGITHLLPPIPKRTGSRQPPTEPNTRPRIPPLFGEDSP